MAQTKKKRRKKHRGNQAGIVERPHHRSGRTGGGHPTTRSEVRQTARERRQARLDRPPTWKGALNRAAIAAVVFGALVIILFDESPAAGVSLAAFMFLLYIPMSFYTDKLIYNRRQQQKAKGS